MQLLSAINISKSYYGHAVLSDISFTVNDGDRIALIGSNGAGKTTLFKIIEGTAPPDLGTVSVSKNTIIGFLAQNVDEQDFGDNVLKSRELLDAEHNVGKLEKEIASCSESPSASLLSEYTTAVAHFEAIGGYDFEHRMKEALAGLGLRDFDFTRSISSMSGGEKMRVGLARLIVQKPDLLLLDEPTNHLDAAAMEWLERFLAKYKGAVLLISHDRYFIDKTSSMIFELENGSIRTYPGNYSAFCQQNKQNLDNQKRLIDGLEGELSRQQEVTQTMLSHRKMSSYHAREKVVAKLSDRLEAERKRLGSRTGKMSFTLLPDAREGDPNRLILQAKSVGMSFDPGKILFRDASFHLKASDKLFLSGPNGCGKTTLLNLLLGRIPSFDGDVLISAKAKSGYMGQFVPFDNEDSSVYDELCSHAELTMTQARNLLARFGFCDIDVYKKISVLSGGERSRLFLCCLLQEKPDILFLDEPTNHLDIDSREILEDALSYYNGAIIAVSHDRYFIDKCASGILGFINKQLIPFDSYSNYRAAAAISDGAFRVEKEVSPLVGTESDEINSQRQSSEIRTRGINRAKERRDTALRKERLRMLEKQIEELEAWQKAAEDSFSKDTAPETYAEYARNGKLLSEIYDEYVLLSEEDYAEQSEKPDN